jgi:uncharacterized membrane protein
VLLSGAVLAGVAIGHRRRTSEVVACTSAKLGTAERGMARFPSKLASSLWFLPVLCVLGGVVLSVGTIVVDRWFDYTLIPRWITGGPDAASSILETVAVSMVSLAALVLTITMVVVQLAMGQFSPRIVQTFLKDRPSQLAIGLFVGTFAFAMLAMHEVQFDGEGQVPGVAIVVSYVLVITSIAMLVIYVNHIGRSLRVSALIELVGKDTREILERQCPDRIQPDATAADVLPAPNSGVLVGAGCVLHVAPGIGEFVPAQAPLVRVEGGTGVLDRQAVLGSLRSGMERTLDEDLAYGFRMLVDMAERSLSDSPFLDPTTAVQCLDRLHDGLRQLATRVIPDGRLYDEAGLLRVTIPTMDWDAYVHLAFDEIRLAGAGSPQVARRMAAALDDLLVVAPADRRPPLEQQRELLRGVIGDAGLAQADVQFAWVPDGQGIGVAASASSGSPTARAMVSANSSTPTAQDEPRTRSDGHLS